jgi:hypothetical protein
LFLLSVYLHSPFISSPFHVLTDCYNVAGPRNRPTFRKNLFIFMAYCLETAWFLRNAGYFQVTARNVVPEYEVLTGRVALPMHRLCGLVTRVPGNRFRGPVFDSRRCQIFCAVVGLERSPLSLVGTIEELLGRSSSGSGLESREYGLGDPLR